MSTPINQTAIAAAGAIPEIGLNLRLMIARMHAGLTQGELAERLGVQSSTIHRAESGQNAPRRTTLMAWAMATGVNLEWLTTGQCPQQGSNLRPADYKFSNLCGIYRRPRLTLIASGAPTGRRLLPDLASFKRRTVSSERNTRLYAVRRTLANPEAGGALKLRNHTPVFRRRGKQTVQFEPLRAHRVVAFRRSQIVSEFGNGRFVRIQTGA